MHHRKSSDLMLQTVNKTFIEESQIRITPAKFSQNFEISTVCSHFCQKI